MYGVSLESQGNVNKPDSKNSVCIVFPNVGFPNWGPLRAAVWSLFSGRWQVSWYLMSTNCIRTKEQPPHPSFSVPEELRIDVTFHHSSGCQLMWHPSCVTKVSISEYSYIYNCQNEHCAIHPLHKPRGGGMGGDVYHWLQRWVKTAGAKNGQGLTGGMAEYISSSLHQKQRS